ncbi:hypothetical protein KSX_00080 [Ktedonospora formicarum]|uniref:Uncharacterized protein n=1 Tax=Ktedonospora formicarum TaxID=2778364 RepID=A0A8J3MNE9_9CHLR|nr:hypothetical protein KSX_00080 [Ktedonospora formicarum]
MREVVLFWDGQGVDGTTLMEIKPEAIFDPEAIKELLKGMDADEDTVAGLFGG